MRTFGQLLVSFFQVSASEIVGNGDDPVTGHGYISNNYYLFINCCVVIVYMQMYMSFRMRYAPILLVLTLFHITHSFYIELIPGTRKCFMITTFPSENILAHIRVPVIGDRIKLELECSVEGQVIFTKEIKKSDDKITISLDNSVAPGKI